MAFGFGSSIGEAFVTIRPETKGFAGEAKRGILGPMKGVATAAAGAFAAVGAVGLIKDTISAASGLNETISKTKVVFGPAAKSVVNFGKKASKALGQSRQEATEAAATFGNLFVSMKIGQRPAAEMSTKLVTLASDLASFNNVSPTEALDALRSGLVGETEPLRRFGVNLNDAALRQEALNLGLVKSTKTVLPPAAKAQAAYALILDQTKTAQGDFARTSGGLANQQRILGARFTDLKAKIGSVLLPAATGLVTFFNESLIPAVQSLSDKLPGALETLKGVFADLADLGATIADKFDLSGIGGKLATEAKTWAGKLIGGVRDGLKTGDFSGLGKVLGEGLAKIIGTGATLVAAFADVDWLKLGKDVAKAAAPFVIGFGNEFVTSLLLEAKNHPLDFALFVASIIPAGRVAGVLAKVLGKVPLLGPLLKSLEGAGSLLEKPVGKIVGFVAGAFKGGFAKHFPGVVGSLKGKLLLLDTAIRGKAIDLARAALRMIGGLISGIGSGLGRVAAAVVRVVAALLRPFAGAGSWLVSRGAQLIGGLVRGIGGAVGRVVGALAGIAGRVRGALGGAASWLFSAGQDIIQGLINGMGSIAGSVAEKARSIASSAIQAAKSALHIGSPSKVFEEIGRNVTAGFVQGMDTQGLSKAMQRFASVPAPAASRAAPVAGAGAGSSVTQHFTLVQQPGQSAPAFIQQAMFAARTQARPA